MKKFKLFFATAWVLIGALATAQTSPGRRVDGTLFPGIVAPVNYVKAPLPYIAADLNSATTATSSATLTRDTTSGYKIDGIASYQCDTSSQNGYCEFKTNTINDGDKSGNCQASFQYKGDARLYRIQIYDGTNILSPLTVLDNASDWTTATFNYTCLSTPTIRITQTEAGTSPAVNLGRVSWSKQVNIGSAQIDTDWVNGGPISITSTGTNPTKPSSGLVVDVAWYRRRGPDLHVRYEYRYTSNSGGASGTGDYLFGIPSSSGCTIDSSKVTFNASSTGDGAQDFPGTNGIASASAPGTTAGKGRVNVYDSTHVRLFVDQASTSSHRPVGVTASNYPLADTALKTYSADFTVPCVGWTATGSAIRSDQTNIPWAAFTPTTQGFGTLAASSCFWKRVSQNMLLDCKITAGTVAASQAQITLPAGNSVSSTNVPTIRLAKGYWVRSNTSATTVKRGTVLMTGGDTFINFSTDDYTGTVNPLVAQNGSSVFSNSDVISVYAEIPISGWEETQNAPILIGGVTQGSQAFNKTIDALINCDASSSITSQNAGVASVGNRSSASCALTLTSGFFSGTPFKCSVTVKSSTVQATSCDCTSATACTIYGPNADYDAYVSIMGN